ncbi:hypothetical protein A7979_00890 [Rothia nasimurium]|uniref:DUF2200 domain-containing protein n=1 Tax=Rothia nasimurium TaxID=85336 RepID=A0A1Y1RRT7_9MICC|nr:DUF2200 domain-containing protein [Rothia nasimurium]ORC22100.1 hypothetical protein A7979_00890 [Rothia nasimurium]
MTHKIFDMPVAEVWPHYLAKVERKGQDPALVEIVTCWLTGYSPADLAQHLEGRTSFRDFFASAQLNPAASLITGSICGYRVQEIEDPLMQQIRYLDKLVDEVAKGRPIEKILRS